MRQFTCKHVHLTGVTNQPWGNWAKKDDMCWSPKQLWPRLHCRKWFNILDLVLLCLVAMALCTGQADKCSEYSCNWTGLLQQHVKPPAHGRPSVTSASLSYLTGLLHHHTLSFHHLPSLLFLYWRCSLKCRTTLQTFLKTQLLKF